jgi:hypothetical protein
MSSILAVAARVNHFVIKMDCELSQDESWLRFSEINSTGIWKAYGTLTNEENGLSGIFEARVLDMPIGIRIEPDKTDVKLFPSANWYDAQPDPSPQQKP